MTPILHAERHWVCPNCTTTDLTRRHDTHTQFHHCPGLAGMWAPMLEDGVRAKVVAVERQDYVGRELVQVDADGRPIMHALVVTDDHQSAVVYAPTALAQHD